MKKEFWCNGCETFVELCFGDCEKCGQSTIEVMSMNRKITNWIDGFHEKHIADSYELLQKISNAEYTRGYKTGYRKALKDAEEKMAEVVDAVVKPEDAVVNK